MALAVLATTLAAVRPALAIAQVPIVAALAGRPPAPRPARRWAGPIGVGLLVLAFFLIGLASQQAAVGRRRRRRQVHALSSPSSCGLVALCAGVVLVAPTCLGLLASAARRAPIAVRLALRDLARYRARSGAALGAISLSMLIAVIICVVAAARFGNALDYVGPNLAANQLVLYTAATAKARAPSRSPGRPLAAQLAAMPAAASGIAASLGSRTSSSSRRPTPRCSARCRAELERRRLRGHSGAAARVSASPPRKSAPTPTSSPCGPAWRA